MSASPSKLCRQLEAKARSMRKKIFAMAVSAGSGHLGSAFSCVEILVSLYYGGILRVKPALPAYKARDRFILSKGHAAIALYAILADRGFFPESFLKKFCREGGCLGVHPERTTPGIEILSGSLGHGLSIGAGFALGAKLNKQRYATVVLMGDGECQEGAVWEAAAFAASRALGNLTAIIDYNKLAATEILAIDESDEATRKKWEAFGWEAVIVDGHSFDSLLSALGRIHTRNSCKPLVIIAHTTKGKGVSFMENEPLWHYRIPAGNKLKTALKELQ